jgi:hypothetical protein
MTNLAIPRTFPVDDVQPAADPLWTEPLSDHLSKRFLRKLVMLPQPERPVVNSYGDIAQRRGTTPGTNLVSGTHPLIDAVHLAFRQHRPLTLSPDSIWLTIAQGFAHHISENAEALRHRLVRHSGKRQLTEAIGAINLAEFQKAIAGFSTQIRDASDPVLHETLICDFSTTTPEVRTASEIVLMDSYASYFTYMLRLICGIPKVTLLGTAADWRRMRARIEVLETFELAWWVNRLRPILDQFIATAEGQPELRFWQAIYMPKETYGSETVTGWIADLFPYLSDAANQPGESTSMEHRPKRRRNHVFNHERTAWAMPVGDGVPIRRFDPGAKFGVATKVFPSGLASVPIKLAFPGGTETELDLVGGFLGVQQDADLSLSPVVSWTVAEKPAPQRVTFT